MCSEAKAKIFEEVVDEIEQVVETLVASLAVRQKIVIYNALAGVNQQAALVRSAERHK